MEQDYKFVRVETDCPLCGNTNREMRRRCKKQNKEWGCNGVGRVIRNVPASSVAQEEPQTVGEAAGDGATRRRLAQEMAGNPQPIKDYVE